MKKIESKIPAESLAHSATKGVAAYRFDFIDDYRGLIIVLMMLDHVSLFLNALWLSFDKFEPVFPDLPQFWLRYSSLPVAPGFLLFSGVMVWYTWQRRVERGVAPLRIRRHLVARGLFLVLLQLFWVNSAWGGFQQLHVDRFGIIGCIGLSMCLSAFLVDRNWTARLLLAVAIVVAYPALSSIPYDASDPVESWFAEVFVTAGPRNSYPLAPWFAMALVGTVIAPLWLRRWTDTFSRVNGTLLLGGAALVLALAIRGTGMYGSEFSYAGPLHPSFILDQKYPPTLFFTLWFFALNMFGIVLLLVVGAAAPWVLVPLRVVGRVPLFFYLIHIPILAILTRRLDIFYRDGGVPEVLLGSVFLFALMAPLSIWFARLKQSTNNPAIKMI